MRVIRTDKHLNVSAFLLLLPIRLMEKCTYYQWVIIVATFYEFEKLTTMYMKHFHAGEVTLYQM
jgi:hypothetical protein